MKSSWEFSGKFQQKIEQKQGWQYKIGDFLVKMGVGQNNAQNRGVFLEVNILLFSCCSIPNLT